MLAELSEQAWALSGRPRPDYDPPAIPVRRIRKRDKPIEGSPSK